MKLIPPIEARFDPNRGSVWLAFDKAESRAPSGEYAIRGGLCWPMSAPDEGGSLIHGAAIVAGQNIKSGIVYLFEQHKWVTVDPVVDEVGGVDAQYPSLAGWMTRQWATYFCHRWYACQPYDTHMRYILQLSRSPMCNPKPSVVTVHWATPEEPWHAVNELRQLKRLVQPQDGPLYLAAQTAAANPDAAPTPIVHAFLCLVVGVSQYPWRPFRHEDDE